MLPIVIRRADRTDGESVGRFLVGLSPKSRYRRFFSPIHYVTPTLIQDMVTTAAGRHVLLALDGETVVGHVIAVAHDSMAVDVGIVVADAYRFRGIGSSLVHELTSALTAVGYREVRCEVLSENQFVLAWLRRLLPDLRLERSGETLTVHGTLTS